MKKLILAFAVFFATIGLSVPVFAAGIDCTMDGTKWTIRSGDEVTTKQNVRVAHRGWNEAPENSLPAIQMALDYELDGAEIDIRFTSESTPVLIHDETINRIARNTDLSVIKKPVYVAESTLEELNKYFFSVNQTGDVLEAYKDNKAVTFEEAAAFAAENDVFYLLDLKAGSQAEIESLIDICKKHGIDDQVVFISKEKDLLQYVSDYLPDAKLTTDAELTEEEAEQWFSALNKETNYVYIEGVEESVSLHIPVGNYPAREEWEERDGQWYLLDLAGRVMHGWVKNAGYWYFLDLETGAMQKGWQYINETWYYFDGYGHMVHGWVQDGDTHYYCGNDDPETGSRREGWVQDGKYWYYMEPGTGIMQTGWKQIDGTTYYFAEDGIMKNGWLEEGNSFYFFGTDGNPNTGNLRKGWAKYRDHWYYMDDTTGRMLTGWKKSGGSWYYLKSDGIMATGWTEAGNNWYYMDNSGRMQTGWKQIGSSWYLFKSSGAMAANEWVNGYWLHSDGIWKYKARGSWRKNSRGWWYGDTSGYYERSTTVTIDGVKYTFDSAGYIL